jgi:2-polyprenyl-3-methyl-5-hydroxy-6-metoxy-1,4-benzoquinol methylase
MPTRTTRGEDAANGWDAAADEIVRGRETTTIGVAVLREWAGTLPAGATVLDLGCGGGVPVSRTLVEAGLVVSGVDASPRMVAAYRARFPEADVACEPAEACSFFGRTFDAIVSIGLLFLLDERRQRTVIGRAAAALVPGGRLLFTAPWQIGTWRDMTTGRQSESLGRKAYVALLESCGLRLVDTYEDEGGNHYYSAVKSSPGPRPG